jgi:L-asparaginase II
MNPSTLTHPLSTTGVVEMAVLERSGLIESRHLGAAVVVGPDGSVLRALGDADALVYPRSSLKLLQAVTVLRAGVELDGEQLVLATASHCGSEAHQRVVEAMLASGGFSEADLGCPADWPSDPDAAARARLHGGKRKLAMNCSGKHASFLLACASRGWSTANYLDPAHPLQVIIRETVEEFTGQSVGTVGVDGCGAPLFGISLRALATAASRVAQARDEHTARLSAAIREHAWAIDGPGRVNTTVIDELGIIAKLGAEGVNVMANADGTAVAVKMLDGSARATTMVSLRLLADAGAIDRTAAEAVAERTAEPVLGGGIPVGSLRVAF